MEEEAAARSDLVVEEEMAAAMVDLRPENWERNVVAVVVEVEREGVVVVGCRAARRSSIAWCLGLGFGASAADSIEAVEMWLRRRRSQAAGLWGSRSFVNDRECRQFL